jgi:hypothetical protein
VVNWSITVYDYETWSMIQTDTNRAEIGSDDDIVANPDGSVDLYLGPAAPKGKEKNWIKTIPGRGWWVWFRNKRTFSVVISSRFSVPNASQSWARTILYALTVFSLKYRK